MPDGRATPERVAVKFEYLGQNREKMSVLDREHRLGYWDEYDMPTRVGHVSRNYDGRRRLILVVVVDDQDLEIERRRRFGDALRSLEEATRS